MNLEMATRRATRRSGVSSGGYSDENSDSGSLRMDENSTLFLECEEEPLSSAQTNLHAKRIREFTGQMMKLESLAAKNAKVTAKSDGSVVFQTTTETTTSSMPPSTAAALGQTILNPPLATKGPTNYRLLMDPRTGRILGTINGSGTIQAPGTLLRGPTPTLQQPPRLPIAPITRPTPRPTVITQQPKPQVTAPTSRMPVASVKPAQVVDLTRSTAPQVSTPQSASVTQAKSKFPALMVHPKPQEGQPSLRRAELDQKVKSLLVLTPAKLTEWLIQQGLVPQEQIEHGQKLKLGMYSDSKKFPNSGGYVWLTDDARNKYVSVFKGSLFETIIQPPAVLIKLIYHWVCQTSLNNVLTWVKIDHVTVDTFYRHMRCVCIATVQEEVVNLGGEDKAVELGVISLGTTTTDGNRREVKVEVLGVLERATGKIRLRATEPVVGSNQAERFARIFKPLPTWIRRDSRIIADFSVDRERLINMGYTNVFQCSAGASVKRADNTNATIMDYLKKVVPRMFQNSLSVLNTNVIQQFLDELTFREVFGKGPLQCFDNTVLKLSTQTTFVGKKNTTMSTRLRTIADNPFGDWRMSFQQQQMPSAAALLPLPPGIEALPPSLQSVPPPSSTQFPSYSSGIKRRDDFELEREVAKKMRTVPTVELESYYYGTIEGDIAVLVSEFKADMAFKCHLCKKVFMNNIEFMKHLSLHVENERATAVDLADLSQCKYCLKDFESVTTLNIHLNDEHYKTNQSFVCRICCESFNQAAHLIHHMNRSHVRSELPYACQVCGYRSSVHREAVDHFTESHDRTDKLQCPRCLKTYSLFSEKGYNSTIAAAFVEHLQSHQDNNRVPCKKCCLSFKDEKRMKGHIDRDHASFKGHDGLETYQYLANDTPTKMPRPEERGMKIAPKKVGAPKMGLFQQSAFAAQNLEDMAMYDVDKDDSCMECRKKMTAVGHYNAYLCCTKCRYSSCCSKALSVHVSIFHGIKAPIFNLGVPSILPKEIFCVCGFATNSGNKMAKHLGHAGCRSAYPSLEVAKKSAVSAAVNDDGDIESFDPNEVMAKAYMTKKTEEEPAKSQSPVQEGPLAFLGLLQKPTSNSPTGENEEDKEKNTEATELQAPQKDGEGGDKIPEANKDVEDNDEISDKNAPASGKENSDESKDTPIEEDD